MIASGAAFVFLPLEGTSFGPISFGWRTVFLVSAFAAAVAAIVRFGVPESPRYLVSIGEIRAAERIVRKLEARAGLTASQTPPDFDVDPPPVSVLPSSLTGRESIAGIWGGTSGKGRRSPGRTPS